ncbi:MAG TPA: hypothetical protein VF521_12300 [Pyrinomonadaceae bacterium]
MLRRFVVASAFICALLPAAVSAASKAAERPQVIKLERFRKALW